MAGSQAVARTGELAVAESGEGVRSATMLTLFERLPVSTRRKLNYGDLRALTGAVLIEDRIHQAYSACAKAITELRRFKRAEGYCGGDPSCLAFVGKDGTRSMCSSCRAKAKEYRSGFRQFTRKPTPYGQLRAKQRALEKAERERAR